MPSTILERFAKMTNSEKLDPKNSRFVDMASKISPESNPVIMICKLK
jgi:Fe-S-cluster formation regulator IscX/YfhJ